MPISKPEAEASLVRLFHGGLIERLPKKPEDARLFLALAASVFLPQVEYSEKEVNEQLSDWLEGFTSQVSLDHVTVRRYLVDHCFLLRDVSGAMYVTNQTVIASVIGADVRVVQPRVIFDAVQQVRLERKRAHQD